MQFSTVYEMLRIQSEKLHGAEAILSPGYTPVTYGELFSQVQKIIIQLHEFGIASDDRVAFILPNGPEMALAFLATACAGISAPLNPLYTAEEYEYYLTDLKAKAILVFQGDDSPALAVSRKSGIKILEISISDPKTPVNLSICGAAHFSPTEVQYPQGENCALMLHTSGTTSRPKLVPLTHKNICISAANISKSLNLGTADRCLNVMPLFHIHGLVGALCATLSAGGSVICAPGFDNDKFFEWVKAFRPTWYTAVPTMHQAILNGAVKNRHIISSHPFRMIRSCSASLPPQLMTDLEREFNAPVVEAYGMTEACHQISINPLPPRLRKSKSVGIPTGTQVTIMNDKGNYYLKIPLEK